MSRIQDATLSVYNANAVQIAERQTAYGTHKHLFAFLDFLPPGAHVLDLGCGSGRDIISFQEAGLEVSAIDGSEGLAKEAKQRTGVDVQVQRFADLEANDAYDGIWASASLLHAEQADLPGHFSRIARALKPGGTFYCSFKEQDSDWVDAIGRFFCAMDEDRLAALLVKARLDLKAWLSHQSSRVIGAHGAGPDGQAARWVAAIAQKPK